MYDKIYHKAHKLTQFISLKTNQKKEENSYLSNFLRKEYNKNNNISVLDIGCDEWRITNIIKNKVGTNINITWIDINSDAITIAQNKYNWINFQVLNNRFIQDNLNNFDIIFSTHVMEHVPNMEEFIDLQIKLLKPNWKIVTIIPQERIRWELQLIPMFLNVFRWVFKNPHVRKISKQQIENIMQSKGFKLIDHIYTNLFSPHTSKERRIDSIGLWCYFEKINK